MKIIIIIKKRNRQCVYNVISRRDLVPVFVKKTTSVIYSECVCL